MDKFLEKISKSKKKGKLTIKADEDEVGAKIESQTYWTLFRTVGSGPLIIPYIGIVAMFTFLEQHREKKFGEWADVTSSD